MSLLQGNANPQQQSAVGQITGNGDLMLSDPGAMMMEDFAPDIDLLDDILGMDVDWKELEPTLLNFNQSHNNSMSQPQQTTIGNQPLLVADNLNDSLGMLASTSSPPHQISKEFVPDLKPNINFLQTTQTINIAAQPPQFTNTTPNFGNVTNSTNLLTQVALSTGQGQNIVPNLQLPTNQQGQGQLFSFTYPLTSQLYNTAVLLPQLQLAVVENKEKLPVKRITTLPKSTIEKEPKKGKKEANRRSSHNAIERRYRSSINDKIIELKNLVCQASNEPNEKVHKAAVLKSSIDTIKYLQTNNSRLDKENKSLKSNLNSLKKCINCGYENNSVVASDLRELLSNTPPPTSSSESDSSSLPCSPMSNPESPSDSNSQESGVGNKGGHAASPLALFAVAAGLFLINPISSVNHTFEQESVEGHPRSRVERSVDNILPEMKSSMQDYSWAPAVITVLVNLFLFLSIYFVCGKFFGKKSRLSKEYKNDRKLVSALEDELKTTLKIKCIDEKKTKLEEILLKSFARKIPNSKLTLKLRSTLELLKVFWILFRGKKTYDMKIADIIGKCYVEIGKISHLTEDGLKIKEDQQNAMKYYCGIKGLQYGMKSTSTTAQETLLASCILTKSKLVLRLMLLKLKSFKATNKLDLHPILSPTLGLPFLNNNLKTPVITQSNIQTTVMDISDPMSKLMHKYKYEMINRGISQLFHCGDGAMQFFRAAMSAVLYEKHVINDAADKCENGNGTVRSRFGVQTNPTQNNDSENNRGDVHCEWWASILWCQSEWITRGGRPPVLERLYKIIDSLWKYQSEDPICKAVYFSHLARRTQIVSGGNEKVLRLVENASEALRDSINLTTDKPKQSTQLIWSVVAESILETRLELWEEEFNNRMADREFLRMFARDLDTLRSLTHVVPNCLPSVYLYEACLRLMSKAAPGRTQQLLDASLRSVRLNQTRLLICNNNNVDGQEPMDLLESNNEEYAKNSGSSSAGGQSCNKRKNKWGRENLVREKRKAIALYLRCKHLPSQVITCPGEKAGMLREALKAMEKFGDHKKINECLEMIRSLGQSVTLH